METTSGHVIARPTDRDERRELRDELMLAVREGMCPRCRYDLDEDGYCAMCGASWGRT